MKRPSSSVLMAVGLTVAAVVWMLTGVGRETAPPAGEQRPADTPAAVPRVAVEESLAREITREIAVSARTEPNRSVELRAETDGRVVALGAERGSVVRSGDRIVGLDMRDRGAKLAEARALIDYAELQFEAARELQRDQFVSETHIAELLSRVVAARAALEEIELEVANTSIAAPFDAVLQERLVELGDYVNTGDKIAELVDTDPLIVVGEVAERNVHQLAVGSTGSARLIDGEPIEGAVRYLAPVADESTRTFRVELAIPNPDAALRAGMTAQLRLAADRITVHVLSPALLSLDEAGTVGVKSVNAHDRVEFHPVEIVESTDAGIFVSGLPEQLRLITVGHGFVKPGDLVEPSTEPRRGLSEASDRADAVATGGA
jgi:multidrug efflux system membrane fusion protein